MEITDLLSEYNYPYKDMGSYINFPAYWRGGDDPTSVAFYKEQQIAVDFVTSQKYNLKQLISIIVGDTSKASTLLNNIVINEPIVKNKLKIPDYFPEELASELVPDYTYFIQRGISLETCKAFKGGLCVGGHSVMAKLKDRQVLSIYDSKMRIIGFTGRSVFNKAPKWKHIGPLHSMSVYPAYLTSKPIKDEKEVFLVESPLCCMKLYDVGIKNSLCLFGTECSHAILNFLLKINPKRIFISTNNELNSENGGVGNKAAQKIHSRLKRYFNPNQLSIYLPPAKDFCEITNNDIILEWYYKR